MNSIIVSETCTAPTAPIQVPLTQLSPLSQTCLSCPSSVHPPPPAPILPLLFPLQTLLSSKALPVHQPETPELYFSIPLEVRRWGSRLFFLACRGVGRGVRHSTSSAVARTFWRWCGRRDTVQFSLVGVEFGHGSLALLRDTMGPRLLKETLPLTAIIIRRGPLNPFE